MFRTLLARSLQHYLPLVLITTLMGWVSPYRSFADCTPAVGGLAAWWAGEGNLMDVLGTNTASFDSTGTFAESRVGLGFELNGADSGIKVPASAEVNVGTNAGFTVECWVNLADIENQQALIEWSDSYIYGAHVSINTPLPYGTGPGCVYANLIDSSRGDHFFSSPSHVLTTGVWQHVAIGYDKVAGTATIWLNGEVVAERALGSFTAATESDLYFGERPTGLPTKMRFSGRLDEIAVYRRELSTSEVQAVFAAGAAGRCSTNILPVIVRQPISQLAYVGQTVSFDVLASGTPPLSYQWQLNGTNLVGAIEQHLIRTNLATGNAGIYTVTVSNSAGSAISAPAELKVREAGTCAPVSAGLCGWWRAEGDAVDWAGGNAANVEGDVAYINSVVGRGFLFDGRHSAIRVDATASLRLQDFSIETWIQRASVSQTSLNGNGNGTICAFDIGGFGLYLDPSGVPVLSRIGYNSVSADVAIVDTAPHHLAVTKSGSTVIFYVDGLCHPAAQYDPEFVFGDSFWIGGIGLDYTFFGTVDELSVFNRSLSAQEVSLLYDAAGTGKCLDLAPEITQQPGSRTVIRGGNTTFVISATGTRPLGYQWLRDGSPIPVATNASLTLTNVQVADGGMYSVAVSNSFGTTLSSNATLTVTLPIAAVRVVTGSNVVTQGELMEVPIELSANGNENALTFSVNFDAWRMNFKEAVLGTGVPGGTLLVNASQANSGRVGLAIALPTASVLGAGTQQVARLVFVIPALTSSTVTAIGFGDAPTRRQLADAEARALPVNFSGAQVVIPAAQFEADVSPRPKGDSLLSVTDWVLLGRYTTRLDYPTNAQEFQRADCAPRSSGGDGTLSVADWVQAGRYAAGLDEPERLAGPDSEIARLSSSRRASDATQRKISVVPEVFLEGGPALASVHLESQGNENAVSFSLSFDPNILLFQRAEMGLGATGAVLNVNLAGANSGKLGFALALPAGRAWPQGNQQLIRLYFDCASASATNLTLALTDLPVPREVADSEAAVLATDYANASVTVQPLPQLHIAFMQDQVEIGWPIWATNFVLQSAAGERFASTAWTNVAGLVLHAAGESKMYLPPGATNTFFRLRLE